METPMRAPLEIALASERLDEGSAEERACFGLLTIRGQEAELTGGIDFFVSAYRAGPLVSGYHLAKWLAYNWWRLCFEPRAATPDWWRSHKMVAIGEGYAWPNISIFSDGLRTTLLSKPSVRPDAKPFRYIGSRPHVVPSTDFQAAVDIFISAIQARLRQEGVRETALDQLWLDVLAERRDPEQTCRRQLEALLGRDADAIEDDAVDRLIADAAQVGQQAVQELAAYGGQGAGLLTVADIRETANTNGYDSSPQDAVRLSGGSLILPPPDAPAWQLGARAARALREQEHIGDEPITDTRLTDLAGVTEQALQGIRTNPNLSFALDQTPDNGRIALRSKWKTGRRFELARLLGERIVAPVGGSLHVATGARTYRQQMQRSFAAELLSPFDAVDAMLGGDYSPEAQTDAAERFQVSDRTIATLLVNHGRVDREELEEDLGIAA
jgi:hypothetical protein